MEEIRAGPVENGHEIIGHYLDAEFCQIAQGGLVVFDIVIPGGEADLDIIVDIDAFHHVHIEACPLDLAAHFLDFLHFPDFAGLFLVQGPNQPRDSGNLPDLLRRDGVVSLAVPAECHLHTVSSFIF